MTRPELYGQASLKPQTFLNASTLSSRDFPEVPSFWICPPNTRAALHKVVPHLPMLAVDTDYVVGLRGNGGKVGTIVVKPRFEAASLERFDRWETLTAVEIEVWVKLDALRVVDVSGVEAQSVVL
jgi:hypothetical protein